MAIIITEECINCGASLTSLICEYCGKENRPILNDDLAIDNEEIAYQISLLEEKIIKLLSMPIPQTIKEKKIKILEDKLLIFKDMI
jgi:hypothetical protein